MPTPLIANSEGRWGSAEALKREQNVRETKGIRPAISTLGTNGLSQSELSKLNFPVLVNLGLLIPAAPLWKCPQGLRIRAWHEGSTRTGNSSLVGALEIDEV